MFQMLWYPLMFYVLWYVQCIKCCDILQCYKSCYIYLWIILVMWLECRFLDTDVDCLNRGISMLFPWARHFICIASVDSAVKWVPGWDNLVKGVQCYVLFGGIALKSHAFVVVVLDIRQCFKSCHVLQCYKSCNILKLFKCYNILQCCDILQCVNCCDILQFY